MRIDVVGNLVGDGLCPGDAEAGGREGQRSILPGERGSDEDVRRRDGNRAPGRREDAEVEVVKGDFAPDAATRRSQQDVRVECRDNARSRRRPDRRRQRWPIEPEEDERDEGDSGDHGRTPC